MRLKPGTLTPEPIEVNRLSDMIRSATWAFFTSEYLLARKQELLLQHATQTDPGNKMITQGRIAEIDHLLGLRQVYDPPTPGE